MMLEDRHFQLSSTINGLGISLFAQWLIKGELKSGSIDQPLWTKSYPTSFSYYLDRAARPAIVARCQKGAGLVPQPGK